MSIITILSINSSGKYSYDPTSVTVTVSPTKLVYELDAKTAEEWMITGMSSTDQKNQLGASVLDPDGNNISVQNANTEVETFNVTINTQHRQQAERKVRIDPQVTNEPQ